VSEAKKTGWTSKFLDGLGVKSAAIQSSGPKGQACGLALAAAFTMAMGGVTLEAHAAEGLPKKETVTEAVHETAYSTVGIEQGDGVFIRSVKMLGTAGKVLISPETEFVSLGAQAALGSASAAHTESSSKGKQAAEIVGTVITATAAAPVFGTLMVINQVHSTYVFVQEEQEKAVKLKMVEVGERMISVQDQFTKEMRMEDRVNRQNWPEDRKAHDQKTMYEMAVSSATDGAKFSEQIQIRYDIEQGIVDAGGTPEPWFTQFNQVKGDIQKALVVEAERLLADSGEDVSNNSPGTIIDKIDIMAAFGGSGLKTSNKNFAEFAKQPAKKHDQELSR
jgi:hypothetical protein